jgi:hypothetical protein
LVDQSRESVGVESTKGFVMRAVDQSFQINFVIYTARRNHILHGKLRNPNFLLAHLFNGSSIVFCCVFTLLLTLGSSDDHLTSLKNKCSGPLWILHSHNDSSKPLRIILSISAFERNLFKVKLLVELRRGHQVLKDGQLQFGLSIG